VAVLVALGSAASRSPTSRPARSSSTFPAPCSVNVRPTTGVGFVVAGQAAVVHEPAAGLDVEAAGGGVALDNLEVDNETGVLTKKPAHYCSADYHRSGVFRRTASLGARYGSFKSTRTIQYENQTLTKNSSHFAQKARVGVRFIRLLSSMVKSRDL
jgi:hypothetical protein